MPKLNKETAAQVNDSGDSREPLPEDRYLATLVNVEVRDGRNPSKDGKTYQYWSWEFDIEHEDYSDRKLWVNTSLNPKAFFKMKEMFDAFGVDTDTDTDELCGQAVILVVSQREIPTGSRAGQIGNNVDAVLPADEGEDEEEDDLDDLV